MKSYDVTYIKDESEWSKVPFLQVDEVNWMNNPDVKVKAQIAWNEKGLYYHGVATEKNIRAQHDAPGCSVCEDSCLEFFFMPEGEKTYLNMESNPNCAIWMGIGTNMPDRIRLMLQDEKEILKLKSNRTSDGWELFFMIPINVINMFYPGYELKKGNVLKANCMKCGDLTEKEHYLSWSPYDPNKISFHESEYFGTMVLR